ncbi:hypothetical protein HCN44_000778 [Aphidius gifuensis]|uniref:SET domain-containing protein n=1 Tax=Aphidius gifuensis TaxID=684658 RepID=A0A834XPC1_APHGI|nr:SET and MYND domain-containing protein 4-like [Aphidius gifuensis]KAF7990973.1 hypothetical protein HCN44_000778 [Aphidius gifuensis]
MQGLPDKQSVKKLHVLITSRMFSASRNKKDDLFKYKLACEELSKFINEVNFESKIAKKSVELRENGNDYFKKNELDKAFEMYTMSMAYAPTKSVELSMAYANRSAVLFKANWFADCLVDIEHALELDYPENLKAKLFLRKANCLQAICPKRRGPINEALDETRQWMKKMDKKNQLAIEQLLKKQKTTKTTTEKTVCYKFDADVVPEKLKSENPALPGLSSAVELQYSKKYGRHLIATRDIKPSEVLAVQEPYINIVKQDLRYKYCWHCVKQTWSNIPCDDCAEVIYCSASCRDKAKLAYHDVECYVLSRILASGIISNFIFPLRIAIKALKEANNSFDILEQNRLKVDAEKDPLTKGFIDGKFDPQKFSSVYSLSHNPHTDKNFEILCLAGSSITAYFLAKKIPAFEKSLKDEKLLKTDDKFISLIGFIDKIVSITRNNLLQVQAPDKYEDIKDTSSAVVIPFSFMNHSCIKMVTFKRQSEKLVLTAVCPIEKGEQIFDNYMSQFFIHTKKQRVEMLSHSNFICDCEACIKDWPTYTDSLNPFLVNTLKPDLREVFHLIMNSTFVMYETVCKNNEIMLFKKEINKVAKVVENYYSLFGANSSDSVTALKLLMMAVFMSQRHFVHLK